jgi:putative inorganic carbon (HCO3(-)) transporter
VIDVPFVITHALWIAGAAVLLARVSYRHWARTIGKTRPAPVGPPAPWLVRFASAEPYLVMVIAPALLFPTPARLSVVVAVAVVWWACRRVTGHLLPPTPLNASLFVLLAMTGISLWATYDVRHSLGKVAGVVYGTMVFWALARWTDSARRVAIITGGFVLAGAGLAVLGLLGTNWFVKFPPLAAIVERLPRVIRGVPGAEDGFNPNAVAGCLVLFIPLQIALLSGAARGWLISVVPGARGRWWIWSQAGVLALTMGTVLLTQSRGAVMGLAAALLAFLTWHSRMTRFLAAGMVAGVAVLTLVLGVERVADLAISRSGPQMAHNVTGRVELWSRAIYAISDVPFTGMGMNVFRKVMPELYPTVLAMPGLDVAHAHNHLLQAALDLGIPGLIAYAALWLTAGVLLVRVYRGSAEPGARALAGGLGAGLIAHFTFSMTDAIPLGAKVGVLFWVALALAISLNDVVSRVDRAASAEPAL